MKPRVDRGAADNPSARNLFECPAAGLLAEDGDRRCASSQNDGEHDEDGREAASPVAHQLADGERGKDTADSAEGGGETGPGAAQPGGIELRCVAVGHAPGPQVEERQQASPEEEVVFRPGAAEEIRPEGAQE